MGGRGGGARSPGKGAVRSRGGDSRARRATDTRRRAEKKRAGGMDSRRPCDAISIVPQRPRSALATAPQRRSKDSCDLARGAPPLSPSPSPFPPAPFPPPLFLFLPHLGAIARVRSFRRAMQMRVTPFPARYPPARDAPGGSRAGQRARHVPAVRRRAGASGSPRALALSARPPSASANPNPPSSVVARSRTVLVAAVRGAVENHLADLALAARAAPTVLLDPDGALPLQKGALHVLVPRVFLHRDGRLGRSIGRETSDQRQPRGGRTIAEVPRRAGARAVATRRPR